ncbi:MAG TPA: VOC family protein [Candidatus Baltobacteraceae bacterium]|nr:VOC family protein [Candidatus Baltobacteraceae bacterium]
MKITLGRVGHFGLAVPDPKKSAKWWQSVFDVEKMFEGEDYVGITSRDVTIVLSKGKPNPETFDHVSFHLPDMDALRAALAFLKERGVDVEDPGDEIGPEAKGSPNMGLWFHDPDGYRWELSVQAKQ